MQRCAGSQSESSEEDEEQASLQRYEHQHQRRNDIRPERRCPCESDREEESDEKEILEIEQPIGQFSRARMRGHGDARQQRTEFRFEAHKTESPSTDADGKHETEEDEELTVSAP